MTKRRWVYSPVDGHLVAEYRGSECVFFDADYYDAKDSHQIAPDIEPFMSPDGTYIQGRSHWREHLKRTDSIEMGHADIKAAQREWTKKQDAQRDRLRGQVAKVAEFSTDGPIAPVQRSGLAVEMANRLHGRPMPDRKEMIKLSLELSKRMKRGR